MDLFKKIFKKKPPVDDVKTPVEVEKSCKPVESKPPKKNNPKSSKGA